MMHDNLKFLIGLSEEVGRAGCQRTWTAFLESAAFVQFKVNMHSYCIFTLICYFVIWNNWNIFIIFLFLKKSMVYMNTISYSSANGLKTSCGCGSVFHKRVGSGSSKNIQFQNAPRPIIELLFWYLLIKVTINYNNTILYWFLYSDLI